MKVILLKIHIVLCALLPVSFAVQAQNFHYIYIQTENQKPFYIKMQEQTMSSSSSGYIIIPKLSEGTYKITIGFPKSTLPELLVTVVLNDADIGYLVRSDVDQGLYMVNLLTKKFVATETQWPQPKNIIKSKDEFAIILSEVVGDSTIAGITVFKKPVAITAKAELSKVVDNSVPVKAVAVIKDETEVVIDNKTTILKLEQHNVPEGLSAKYIDGLDTVTIFMPVAKTVLQTVIEQKAKDTIVLVKKETEPAKDVKFIDRELQNPNKKADSGVSKKDDILIAQKKKALDSTANSKLNNCKSTATQKDFLDLRKKMVAQKTATAMQKIVTSELNKNCFTTEQIKNLGALFITEEERYKFYVLAFQHVFDTENFASLESQLLNNYYITRFKAMLNH